VTVENTLNTAANTTLAVGSNTLNIGSANTGTGSWTNNGTFQKDTGTVNYAEEGDQTILALEYYGLGVSGAGTTKTFANGTTRVDAAIQVSDTITLTGSSADNVTVQVTTPGAGGTQSRVFHVNAANKNVNIRNMTILGGDIAVDTSETSAYFGGGIFNEAGHLTVENAVITGSKAGWGGGIYHGKLNSTSTLTVNNTTVSNCIAIAHGAGLYCYYGPSELNTVTLVGNNTTNAADGYAGGICNDRAVMSISNSAISENNAMYGGGASNWLGTLTISNSTISGNGSMSGGTGGGVDNYGEAAPNNSTLTIINSTISGNSAGDGGGIMNNNADSAVIITNSIIAYNHKQDNYAYLDMTNSGTATGDYNVIGNYALSGTNNTNYSYTSGKGSSLFATYDTIVADTIYKPVLADSGGPTETVALAGDAIANETGVKIGYYDDSGTTKYAFYNGTNWVQVEDGTTLVGGVTEITIDQRGANRHDTPCIGAYELYADYTTNGTGTDWSTAANWNMDNGVTSPVASTPPTADNSTSITVNHDMTVNTDVVIDQTALSSGKTLTVNNGQTLTVANGGSTDLTVTGSLVNNGTVTCNTDSTVLFNGVDQPFPANVTFKNLTIDGGGTKSLTGAAGVDDTLTLTNGLVALGDNDLTLASGASFAGTPSASNMIVTNGTGVLKKMLVADGEYLFPLGDNTGTAEYSPATLIFTADSYGSAWAAVNVTNSKQPNNTSPTNYLNRYWTVTQSGITGFSCDTTFNYVPADVAGTEADIYGASYSGSAWTVFDPVNSATHIFEATVSSFSDFTGVERPAPEDQASNLTFSNVTHSQMTVSWTRGGGDNVLVVAHQGTAVDSNPVDGADYAADSTFKSGSQIGTGNYVVYKGTGTSVNVTGLTASATYHFRAYEFNDAGGNPAYNTATATGNPNSQTTLPDVPEAPVAKAATSVTQTGFTANWNASPGATGYRLDVATDSAFTSYVSGYQNKAVGNVTTSGVSGLSGGTTYYYRVRAENSSGTSGNSNTISSTSELPTQVTLSGPATLDTKIMSTAFTLTSKDTSGKASNVTADTTFTLSSDSTGRFTFYSDAAGKFPIIEVTIKEGASQTTFYYRDNSSGNRTVTASWQNGGTNLGNAAHQLKVIGTSLLYVSKDGTCGGMWPCYDTLQAAVDEAGSDSIIFIGQGTFNGDIVLNTGQDLTLKGGWNDSFVVQTPGTTFIKAPVVNQGTVKLQMLSIKPLP
jgi:hypothetical protein